MENNTTNNTNATQNQTALSQIVDGSLITSERNKVNNLIQDIKNTTQAGIESANKTREAMDTIARNNYNSQKSYLDTQSNINRTAFAQSQRFGTSTAQAKLMTDQITKTLSELDKNYQNALATNATEQMKQIAQLKMEQLDLLNKTNQQLFNNTLGVGQMEMQYKKQQAVEKAQEFQRKSTLGNIALKYGIELNDGDTLESVIQRAKPFASQEEQKKLDLLDSQIQKEKQYINKLKSDIALNNQKSASLKTKIKLDADKLAKLNQLGILSDEDLTSLILKDPSKIENAGELMDKVASNKRETYKLLAKEDVAKFYEDGEDIQDIKETIESQYPFFTPEEIDAMILNVKTEIDSRPDDSMWNDIVGGVKFIGENFSSGGSSKVDNKIKENISNNSVSNNNGLSKANDFLNSITKSL